MACEGERNAVAGAKLQAAAAWLAMAPACVPSPTAIATCPIAIGAAIGSIVQLKGNMQQLLACLTSQQKPAPAKKVGDAIAALDADLAQLENFKSQFV